MATMAQKIAKQAGAYIRCEMQLSLPVTATANTDFLVTLPAGAKNISLTEFTTTAYGAATDAQLTVGTSAGDESYVAAVSIKTIARRALTLVNAAADALLNVGGVPLYIRIAQTGTASATGAGVLVIGYSMLA